MKKCKSCQTEISDKAKKCPNCKSDQRNWFMRHKIMSAILAIVVIAIIASASGSKSDPTSSKPAAPDKTSQVATSPVASAAPKVLLDVSGSGTKSTQKFTVASDWDLNYSYDCSSFGNQGNFQVYIYNGDGSMSVDNTGVNQLGSGGSDVEHYHKGGTYYLEINSECSWHVTVRG